MPDSCMYQIGDPTTDRQSAFILCSEYRGMDVGVQIFDDKGEGHIIEGRLKKIYDNAHDNSFLNNTITFFDKLMKKRYVSKSEILDLKKKFKVMKENGMIEYNNLLNRITNISNKAPGKNEPTLLQDVYYDFQTLLKK